MTWIWTNETTSLLIFLFSGFQWWVTVAVICGFDLEAQWWDQWVHALDLWVTILFWWLIVFARWLWFCFGFLFFFSSCSGLDQPLVSAWLRFCFCSGWLFLWWLGGGWLSFWWMVVLILWVFSFSFLPASGCGVVICGGGGYGGLWLLQWWLWQVERWWRRWLL